jgi:hypothetical protein
MAASDKQGVWRAECTEAKADDYATVAEWRRILRHKAQDAPWRVLAHQTQGVGIFAQSANEGWRLQKIPHTQVCGIFYDGRYLRFCVADIFTFLIVFGALRCWLIFLFRQS